ncbi:putative ribonuclease H-like domain-containing protein [Tanacetum coccineum]|uniref:Ribonuclease H-like domain-containing protein n=1 Tax=Tanacetum coccineum TaxID=301880 RepID=A0ABQ5IBI0_9ASTR
MSQPANDEFSQHLSDDEESNHEDASDTGAAPKQQQQVIPQTTAISNIKLPIRKGGISTKRMEHKKKISWNGMMKIDHGNPSELGLVVIANSKKIQRPVFQNNSFEAFTISSSEWYRKRYDRSNNYFSYYLPEAHGAEVSNEDANYKFLRSLPPAWSNLAMTMRTKPDVDTLYIDDLYNNLRVFEQEIQGASKTSLSAQNVAFVSQSKSSTNKVKSGFTGAYSTCTPSTSSTNITKKEVLAGFANEKKERLSLSKHQEAGKQRKLDGLADKGLIGVIVNWGEHTIEEETNQALMAISSSNEGPQELELNVSDDRSSEYSTCQSNDSAGSIGTSSEHSVDPKSKISSIPPEVYVSTPITTNEKGVSDPKSKEVEPSCVSHIKTPRQPIKDQATPKVNRKNWNAMMERELGEGYSFTKKKCFVCGSLSHLIKDCDYYEKKMAREAEVKKQRVFNTGNGVAKPVWTNANRVNHSNKFVPRSVQLNAGRPNINSVRPNINTGRTNINSVRPNINTGRTNVNPVRPRVNTGSSNVNTVRSRQPVPNKTSNSFSPKRPQGNWGSAVKTSAGYNWRNSKPNSNCDNGPTFIRIDHPLKNMVDRGIFDSGCSGHMTGNKDQLEDFEEFNGGSVTFGGSKGYISGKGKIRVGNLDFDSVSFVKELGHFNLFSISQICDKQHKVLFTETECLVVSSDFKMPDENQILLKVPRHHNMYSFDMKTPTPAKGFACLIAKATSDESKLWHRRLGHINFKNLNKLVKGNLVRGLPSKVFKNDHTCVACHKGKQHRASCKAKLERLITEPLHTLHMDLFGPTSVKSINHASYCLVITDDCTRFSWVFFLASKDETSGILQNSEEKGQERVRLSTSASGNHSLQGIPGMIRFSKHQDSKKQDNSDYVCITSDDCMSSDNLCVYNSMNDVKFHAKPKKSKSKKTKSKKDIWKTTGKVFTQIGYFWRPTGRTFTIVGNACPIKTAILLIRKSVSGPVC